MGEFKSLTQEELDLLKLQATTTSLVAFREYYLAQPTDVKAAPFHHRWSDLLLKSREHVAIQGFRESAKDQYVFQTNILHALTYPTYNRSYIVIIAGNKTQASQKLKDITAETVRTSCNGEDLYVRILDGFHKNRFQVIYGRIGIRECLKICDERPDRPLSAHCLLPAGELFGDGEGRRAGKITGSLRTAEDAAAGPDMPVPVGAGHPAVQSDFVDFFSKCIFQVSVECIPAPAVPEFSMIHKNSSLYFKKVCVTARPLG